MRESRESGTVAVADRQPQSKWLQTAVPLLITVACFAYLYTRLAGQAAREGSALLPYLAASFENVSWSTWLALMVPYCVLFLLIDTLVTCSVINWFNTS